MSADKPPLLTWVKLFLIFISHAPSDTIIKKEWFALKKFFNRVISRHLFSYLLICFAYIYSVNKFDHVPSFLSTLFILFVFISLAESTYQQNLEDKAAGKKHQTFKQFIHNVDWPIVITVVFICIAIYAGLVIFIL